MEANSYSYIIICIYTKKVTHCQNHYGNHVTLNVMNGSESFLIDLTAQLYGLVLIWLIMWPYWLVFAWLLWSWCRALCGSFK